MKQRIEFSLLNQKRIFMQSSFSIFILREKQLRSVVNSGTCNQVVHIEWQDDHDTPNAQKDTAPKRISQSIKRFNVASWGRQSGKTTFGLDKMIYKPLQGNVTASTGMCFKPIRLLRLDLIVS